MRLQLRIGALCVAVWTLAACSAESSADVSDTPVAGHRNTAQRDAYEVALERARAERLNQLRARDGWLSYTGSGRVRAGQYRVGSDPHSDIVLPAGPAQLGQLTLDAAGQVRFRADGSAAVTLNGQRIDEVRLQPERAGPRGDRLDVGGRQFYLVQTGALYGWRFRDPAAPALTQFDGLEYFPTDPQWRIQAQWQPYPTPRTATLLTSIGTPLTVEVPGKPCSRAMATNTACGRCCRTMARACSSCSPTAPAARKVMAARVICLPHCPAMVRWSWISIWPKTHHAH